MLTSSKLTAYSSISTKPTKRRRQIGGLKHSCSPSSTLSTQLSTSKMNSMKYQVGIATAGVLLTGILYRGYRQTSCKVHKIVDTCVKADDIVVPDKNTLQQKLERIKQGGYSNLQVIADFDRTITHAKVNGKMGASCHGVIESLSSLTPEYKAATGALFDKYFPIETCATRTREDKIPLMYEWYTQAHNLLLQEHFTEENIADAVREANLALREGWVPVMSTLQANNVPLLVFSAGIANVIHEVFAQKFGPVTDSTHIVSNWIKFDNAGKMTSFSEPLIHMFNKDSSQTRGSSYAASVVERTNAILLGDGLGDVTMADGIPHEVVLKVGFLNDKVEALLPKYKQIYDVIILNDGSMSFVESLLESLE